ncbi:serine hydrolase domain-containing protein [Polaromonas jejuensis]|uniref:Serine hydrolase domain-containing protein n=1 Tax=Polaromonas jejuensis TaxID=457502 RepID=A0ABW0QFA5_9BURK|nr:serine hydrolase [Polaromonas jejuensis]
MSGLSVSNGFRRTPLRSAFVALALQALFAGAAMAAEPEIGLETAAPEAVGVDSALLVRMSEWIRKDKLDVRSLLIIKDGKLIFERYGDGLTRDHNYELYSVTKTITALTFGVLAGEGKIATTDRVAKWLLKDHPEFEQALGDKKDIELGHLMSMSSGLLYKQVEGSDPLYFQAPNRLKVALGTVPRIPPATLFEYTDANPVLVGAAMAAAAGQREDRYAEERLFKPLGMRNYRWTGADQTGTVSGGWGMRLRAVDMAKLGMLMLNDGQWQGKQVVPASWIRQMSTPSSQATAQDYGYYTWINHIVRSEPEFGAMGFKGQFITVLPKERAVVVMTGILATDGGLRTGTYLNQYRRMVNDYILPAMKTIPRPQVTEAAQQALRKELELSAQVKGVPGTGLAFNDAPEK